MKESSPLVRRGNFKDERVKTRIAFTIACLVGGITVNLHGFYLPIGSMGLEYLPTFGSFDGFHVGKYTMTMDDIGLYWQLVWVALDSSTICWFETLCLELPKGTPLEIQRYEKVMVAKGVFFKLWPWEKYDHSSWITDIKGILGAEFPY